MTRHCLLAAALLCGAISFAASASAYPDRHSLQTGMGAYASHDYRVVMRRSRTRVALAPSESMGRRPSGCPSRFCGCALALKLFGRIVPRLNLASNWKAFPRTAPAPGMVAARSGHVFELLTHVSGNVWNVWDPNSGGGQTRVHQRSVAGYTIHNPRGSRLAAAM